MVQDFIPNAKHGSRARRPGWVGSWRTPFRAVAHLPEKRARRRQQRQHVVLFLQRLDGTGGVCRSVTNLANGLVAAGVDVTLLVLFRRRQPRYELDDRVTIRYVRDLRPGPRTKEQTADQQRLEALPTQLCDAGEGMSALTDRQIKRALGRLGACTVITHRPNLHQAAALWAPEEAICLALEHTTFTLRPEVKHELIRSLLPRLDQLVTLTDENKGYWQEYLGSDQKLTTIPNAVPFRVGGSLTRFDRPVLVAAGSLIPRKGFDRLIEAFGPLASEFPDWELRIFGSGPEKGALTRLIKERGLGKSVRLMGYTRSLEAELLRSSVFVMSSHSEALPMVLLEAMGVGLPIVAFDCSGPKQLVSHRRSGLLVADGDITGMTAALRTMMADEGLRRTYGEEGRAMALAYHPDSVVAQWQALIRRVS